MTSTLKIVTSYVSPKTLEYFVGENYLPIFILRHIINSEIIGKYSRTAIHFPELSPSSLLFQHKRDGKITIDEFKADYLQEMAAVNLKDIIHKLDLLTNFCNTDKVVLMGYGKDDIICHRSALRDLLNNSGLLDFKIIEKEI